MLTYTDTVLRVALNRLNVETEALMHLIQVTTPLFGKTSQGGDLGSNTNPIMQVIFEVLLDALRLKARVLPKTIKAMLEALMVSHIPSAPAPAMTHLKQFLGYVVNYDSTIALRLFQGCLTQAFISCKTIHGQISVQKMTLRPHWLLAGWF
jgi:hypothetical protein